MRKKIAAGENIARFFLAALLVLALFPGRVGASPLLDRVVAIVDKEVITWSELYRAMEFEMMSSSMKSIGDEDKKKLLKENEIAFLEAMIDRKLQLQLAKRVDISASKEEVAEAIAGIKKKYSMDDKEFQESLKKEGFTLEEYNKRLVDHIILSKLVSQQVKNKIVVSDKELNEYIAKNRGSEYRVKQIFFRSSDKEGEKAVLEAKAEEVLQRLKNGEDFSGLAQRYSDDPTGRVGGDLGFVKKEDLGKEFVDVLSQIGVGEVSKPFWTSRGLHIIKLEEKVDGTNAEEFRENVKKKLFDKHFEDEYRNWIRMLR
ncbi:MAG TPA: peptidylprolyl isomerase, partial [Thermodesulfovibrionales bacterium]|nr:peptidylprolyl isomerase [Thermodesulfovibrionales bacterium]